MSEIWQQAELAGRIDGLAGFPCPDARGAARLRAAGGRLAQADG
ncbi:hypothetical protein [Streptomyces sp. NPDC086989]